MLRKLICHLLRVFLNLTLSPFGTMLGSFTSWRKIMQRLASLYFPSRYNRTCTAVLWLARNVLLTLVYIRPRSISRKRGKTATRTRARISSMCLSSDADQMFDGRSFAETPADIDLSSRTSFPAISSQPILCHPPPSYDLTLTFEPFLDRYARPSSVEIWQALMPP